MPESKTEANNTTITEPQPEAAKSSPRQRVKAHIAELEEKVTTLSSDLEAERDRRLRALAEYDNYRRRTQGEFRQIIETAGERILLKILPVVDDFERLLAHARPSEKIAVNTGSKPMEPAVESGGGDQGNDSDIHHALELIYRKLQKMLESEGITHVPVMGTIFDASTQEAVAHIPTPDAPDGAIIAEVERGYKLRDKIIRHAKVVVAQSVGDLHE